MKKIIILLTIAATLALGQQNTNNGHGNTNCHMCGQGNGGNIMDPATQGVLDSLRQRLPFLNNLNLNPRRNLKCPVSPFFFETTRSEPRCRSQSDCTGSGVLCCPWGRVSHCLQGIDTAPKGGTCPNRPPTTRCRADFPGCRFDSECLSSQKCCETVGCSYSECTDSNTPAARPPTAGPPTAGPPTPGPPTAGPPTAGPPTAGPPTAGPPSPAPVSSNLACPVSPFFFPTTRSEPTCITQSQCTGADELCCFWGRERYCLKGIVTTPKPGVCPNRPRLSPHECLQDFAGCRFDSECPPDQKCCKTDGCGYSECQTLTNIGNPPPVGPPTAGPPTAGPPTAGPPTAGPPTAGPPTAPPNLSNLACPVSPLANPLPRNEPRCSTQSDCSGGNELCCFWGRENYCLKGIDTTSKSGTCPNRRPTNNCKQDFAGCRFDSECSSNEKCCETAGCHYKECQRQIFRTPTYRPPPPGPPTTGPIICTQIACPPAPGPSCQNVGQTFPNGPQCGACPVCNDPPRPPSTARPTTRPVRCTRIGCPPRPGPSCQNVGQTFPNGPQCGACPVCNDPPRSPSTARPTTRPVRCTKIGCPPRPGPSCQNVGQTFPNGPQCGACPVCNDPPRPPTVAPPTVRPPTSRPHSTGSTSNLACPVSPFFFPTTRSEPMCTTQSQCTGADELCCFWGRERYCLKGIVTSPRPGVCPNRPRQSCKQDFAGCRFDSECSSNEKCCETAGCGYSECQSLATRMADPTRRPPPPGPPTTGPIICTLIACPPAPGPSCQNVGQTFPNGPQCGACPVCNDPPRPPSTARPTTRPVPCTLRACPPAPGPSCQNVGQTFPNGPLCGACPICNDLPRPTTNSPNTTPQQHSSTPSEQRSCKSLYGSQYTVYESCQSFARGTVTSHGAKQSCAPGTLFDLSICGCNHQALVNKATCKS